MQNRSWRQLAVAAIPLILAAISLPALAQEAVVLEIPSGAEAGPGFDVDTATAAYVNLLSEEERARSDAYFEGGYWLQLWGFIYGIGVAWILLSSRISAKMRDLAERVGKWRPLHTFLYGAQYIVVGSLLTFPLTVYQGFFREHAYGLATQTFGAWMGDQFTGLIVGMILGAIVITLVYAVIRKAPNTWWVWGAGVSVLFLIFVMVITPVFVNPLFNDYKPLEDGPLRDSILSMARANDIPGDDVYWFDASKQTTRISANVSGALGTTRISLNDNLLNRTSPEEIEAVMGHEMGHYILNHGKELVTQLGLVLAVGFAFVAWAFNKAHGRWGQKWGIRDIGDTAGLPLFAAVLSVYFFVMTPITNSIVRIAEAEADNYGINVSRQPDGFARVAMRLSEYRKINPGPVERFIFYDHPSGYDRVRMAMQWKSENMEDGYAEADASMRLLEADGFTGSVMVARNGHVLFEGDYGFGGEVASPPSYWIASITKQFTAAAILLLHERGALDIHAPLARYLPDVPADKSNITLFQLLTHTSGLAQRYAADGISDREEAIHALLSGELQSPPGTAFSYANDNYNLLAIVIELVSGQSYEDFLDENVIVPAGMSNTGHWGMPVPAGVDVPQVISPFSASALEPNWGFRGATGMRASVPDLYNYLEALRSGRLLTPESVDLLMGNHVQTSGGTEIGFNWFGRNNDEGVYMKFSRGQESFGGNAVIYIYPEKQLTIITATNAGPAETGDGPVTGWSRLAHEALAAEFLSG